MNPAKMFWGLLIVAFGVLILLANLGFLPLGFWWALWQFWPVLLVVLGLSLIFGRKSNSASWIFLSITVILIVATGLISYHYPKVINYDHQTYSYSEEIEDAESLALRVDFGAGGMNIGASDTKLIEGKASTYTKTTLKRSGGIDTHVIVDQAPMKGWFFLNPDIYTKKNEIELNISDDLPLDLAINTGASSFDLDLSDLLLEKLDLDFGASDGKIKIGEKVNNVEVKIETGASSLKLYLPKEFGIKIESSSGISSNNFEEIGLNRSNGKWESDNYGKAEKKADIDLAMGASSIDVELY